MEGALRRRSAAGRTALPQHVRPLQHLQPRRVAPEDFWKPQRTSMNKKEEEGGYNGPRPVSLSGHHQRVSPITYGDQYGRTRGAAGAHPPPFEMGGLNSPSKSRGTSITRVSCILPGHRRRVRWFDISSLPLRRRFEMEPGVAALDGPHRRKPHLANGAVSGTWVFGLQCTPPPHEPSRFWAGTPPSEIPPRTQCMRIDPAWYPQLRWDAS